MIILILILHCLAERITERGSFVFQILEAYSTPIAARVFKSQKMIIFCITIPDCTSRGKREVVFLSP